MKELRNNFDRDAAFSDLQEAKNYYLLSEELLNGLTEEDYLGDNFDEYLSKTKEYNKEINEASTLEELATILNSNSYSDLFEDGRYHTVVEF